MTKKIVTALIIGICLQAGCQQKIAEKNAPSQKPTGKNNSHKDSLRRTGTTPGMIEYLQQQQLPLLKSTEAWQSGFGTGLKLTTSHYEIYTTLLDPLMLRDLTGFLESCYLNFQQLQPTPAQTSARFTVYLFDKRPQWEKFTDQFAGIQAGAYKKIKAGAYYLNGNCIAYNIGRERTFQALGHECWHQFVERHWAFRLPSWANEGVAMQFESNRCENGLFYFEPANNNYRLQGLRKTILNNQLIPLAQLISMDPGDVLNEDNTKVAAFYSQCYALVRFLLHGQNGKYSAGFKRLLSDGLEGKWPLSDEDKALAANRTLPVVTSWNQKVGTQLFKFYISSDIEPTEKEYLDFCTGLAKKDSLKRQ